MTRAALATLLADLEHVAGNDMRALRPSRAANIHLTLHFLGNLDESRETALRLRLAEPLAAEPFDITLGETGTFPHTGAPRVLWVAVAEGREALTAIHRELGERLATSGITLEGRPFAPHLTLARVRDGEQPRARRIAERLPQLRVPAIRWPVTDVTLYNSDLSGPAPRYEAVQHVSLRASREAAGLE